MTTEMAVFVYFIIGIFFATVYRFLQEGNNPINRHVHRNTHVLLLLFAWPIVFFCSTLAGIVWLITGERLFKIKTGWRD